MGNTEWQGDGHGPAPETSRSVNSLPASGRGIGPVTFAAGGAAAATTVVCWLLSLAGIDVPGEVQGSLTVLFVLAAGYAVKPASRGDHAA